MTLQYWTMFPAAILVASWIPQHTLERSLEFLFVPVAGLTLGEVVL